MLRNSILLLLLFSRIGVLSQAIMPAQQAKPPFDTVIPAQNTQTHQVENAFDEMCAASFYKTFRSQSFSDVASGFVETADDQLLLSARMREKNEDAGTSKTTLFKADKKGTILFGKKIEIGKQNYPLKLLKLRDGHSLLLGYFYQPEGYGLYVCKLDSDLNAIWTKIYKIEAPSFNFMDFLETEDGNLYIYLYYYDFPNLNDRMVLINLDDHGNFKWQHLFRSSEPGSQFGARGKMASSGRFLFCTAQFRVENVWKTLLVKFDKQSGTVIWAKQEFYGSGHTDLNMGMALKDNHIYLTGLVDYSRVVTLPAVVRLTLDGTVEKAVLHKRPNTHFYNLNGAADGGLLLTTNTYDFSVTPSVNLSCIVTLDPNLTVINSRQSPTLHVGAASAPLLEDQTGDYYEFGSNWFTDVYNADLYLKKYFKNGQLGTCNSDTFEFEEIHPTFQTQNQEFKVYASEPLVQFNTPFSMVPYAIQENKTYCNAPSNCTTLAIAGTASVCDSSSIVTFTAARNTGCTVAVNWQVSSRNIKIREKSDTVLRLQFLQNENVTIRATSFTGCKLLEDSLKVAVHLSPGPVMLGNDTILCANNTIQLNAAAGYASYKWQDNTAAAAYTVTKPGIYHVEAKDACNVAFRDTVQVKPMQPIVFDLGAAQEKCNSDSLAITAPDGFMNYNWFPKDQILQSNNQTATFYPAVTTMYNVIAEKIPGCFVEDSITIVVNHSKPIYLGQDTSFCAGDFVTLNAGAGFQRYLWSNGATGETIIADAKGTYRVQAWDQNGCTSSDALAVVALYKTPVIQLPKDSVICFGATNVLDAGNGYANFNWNTGSRNQKINVNAIGKYKVEVQDRYGCTGTDSVTIKRILPVPGNFLPKDTSLCSYGSLQLKPSGNYSNYLWNTGGRTNAITVTQPGIYWLEATDNWGCKGGDSITIRAKQCNDGFYIPNAFTPNGDGKNDLFQPLLFGNVTHFHFTVYNRYGEIVFETKDLHKGWDGKTNGKEDVSFTYVWTCEYQFNGNEKMFGKGTVVLVR